MHTSLLLSPWRVCGVHPWSGRVGWTGQFRLTSPYMTVRIHRQNAAESAKCRGLSTSREQQTLFSLFCSFCRPLPVTQHYTSLHSTLHYTTRHYTTTTHTTHAPTQTHTHTHSHTHSLTHSLTHNRHAQPHVMDHVHGHAKNALGRVLARTRTLCRVQLARWLQSYRRENNFCEENEAAHNNQEKEQQSNDCQAKQFPRRPPPTKCQSPC